MTTCRNGHEMTPQNTGTRYRHGDRETYCKACEAASRRLNNRLAYRSANQICNLAALAARPAEA